jgi:hypothetical protein
MSIRDIARDLYRLEREVEQLQDRLKTLSGEKREELEQQFRKTRVERDRVRDIIESKKEPLPYRKLKR